MKDSASIVDRMREIEKASIRERLLFYVKEFRNVRNYEKDAKTFFKQWWSHHFAEITAKWEDRLYSCIKPDVEARMTTCFTVVSMHLGSVCELHVL